MKVFYIGWDVGAWSCKAHKNKSCDALVVLDENKTIKGFNRKPLIAVLNNATTTKEFTDGLLKLCKIDIPNQKYKVVLAIDTPLGFSNAFKKLITSYNTAVTKIDKHIENPYLFRDTERFVYNTLHKRPLSPVNDMIGAQATKGLHVISKFAPNIKETGVWCNTLEDLLVFEAYPAITTISKEVLENKENIQQNIQNEEKDIEDAFKCAYIASVFHENKDKLFQPDKTIDATEGWIWFEKEEIHNKKYKS